MKRRPSNSRVTIDDYGIDEVSIDGIIHIEAMGRGVYCVVLGDGPDSRSFSVGRRGGKTVVVDKDGI